MKEKDLSHIQVIDYAGKLAKAFLYNPLTALLAVFLLAIGYISLEVMPREEDPQIAISGGSVIVVAPGMKPKQIEKVIVEPLEQKLREIKGVEHIYSMEHGKRSRVVNVMVLYRAKPAEISQLGNWMDKSYAKYGQSFPKKHLCNPALVKGPVWDIGFGILPGFGKPGLAFFSKRRGSPR